MNLLSILLILIITFIIFYPLFFSNNSSQLAKDNIDKENYLEILRSIELEYELGNINKETYLKSKSDYASKLKIILEQEDNASN